MAARADPAPGLKAHIESNLHDSVDRPICVHGLYESLKDDLPSTGRDDLVEKVRSAAEALVAEGQARHAYVSAIAIGAHCEDEVFWSSRSPHQRLEEFGPEFDPMEVARRLASHFVCHGL